MLPVLNLSCFSLRGNAFFNDQTGDEEKDPRHLRGGVGYGRWRVIAPAKPVHDVPVSAGRGEVIVAGVFTLLYAKVMERT